MWMRVVVSTCTPIVKKGSSSEHNTNKKEPGKGHKDIQLMRGEIGHKVTCIGVSIARGYGAGKPREFRRQRSMVETEWWQEFDLL